MEEVGEDGLESGRLKDRVNAVAFERGVGGLEGG
jgi:hypothetical protein